MHYCLSETGFTLDTFTEDLMVFTAGPYLGYSDDYNPDNRTCPVTRPLQCQQQSELVRQRCSLQSSCHIPRDQVAVDIPGCGTVNYLRAEIDRTNPGK